MSAGSEYTTAEETAIFSLVGLGVFVTVGAVLSSRPDPGVAAPSTDVVIVAGFASVVGGSVAVLLAHFGVILRYDGTDSRSFWFDVLAFLLGTTGTIVGQVPLYYVGVTPPFQGLRYLPQLLPLVGGFVAVSHDRRATVLQNWIGSETWTDAHDWVLFGCAVVSVLFYLMRMFGPLQTGLTVVVSIVVGEAIVELRTHVTVDPLEEDPALV